jgi:hypothetical protein
MLSFPGDNMPVLKTQRVTCEDLDFQDPGYKDTQTKFGLNFGLPEIT